MDLPLAAALRSSLGGKNLTLVDSITQARKYRWLRYTESPKTYPAKWSADERYFALSHSRIRACLAAGHTLGFLKFKAPTPEGVAVQQAMDNVRFHLGAKSYSYGDFYRGFGLFCTAYLLFIAFLAWHMGDMARNTPQAIGALGWVFFCLQLAGIVLSWRYFVLPPVIFSAVLAILTGWAAWLVNTTKV